MKACCGLVRQFALDVADGRTLISYYPIKSVKIEESFVAP